MAAKRKKLNSKLPSDWRIHMFSDIHSTDDELDYDFGVDNPVSVISQWHMDRDNRTTISTQSLQTCRKQFVQELDKNGSSVICNADIHIVDSDSASDVEDIDEASLHRNTQERDSGQLGQEKFQTRVSPHGEQGPEQESRRQVRSQSVTNAMLNRPGPPQSQRLSNASAIHEHHPQVFKNQLESQPVLNPRKNYMSNDAVEFANYPVTDYTIDNHRHQMKKQPVDLAVGKQLRTLKVENSGSPSINNHFPGHRRHTEPHTGVSVSNSHSRDTEKDSSLNPINAQDVSEEATSQDILGNSPRMRSRQPFRQLCVQSLDEKAGETTQYLPADDKAESPKTKTKAKGWEKIRSMLRRKSKNNVMLEDGQEGEMSERVSEEKSKKAKKGILRGRGSEQDKAEDVYTVSSPVVSLDDRTDTSSISSLPDACSEGPPHKRRQRRRNMSPILLKRRPLNNLPTTSPNTPTSSLSNVSPSSSPLMQTATGIFGLQEEDTDSDTSSVTSDSQVSSDNLSDSGDSGRGREQSVEEILANLSRRTVEQVERENRVNFDPQLDSHSQVPEISCQVSTSLMTSNRSARSQSPNKAPSMPFKGPYGKVFTAKFLNCLGRKGILSNVTNVSHVQKGTVLVTQLISGELLHMASSGHVMKRFEVDPGSEPWCACVTPRGHVAVTIKNPACVTVWSGNGTLLQEFGHSVLQSPTGLACDRKGNFIVADERTNRVAVFSPHGQFLQYLTQSPPTCTHDNDNKSVEEPTACDNKSVTDNEENKSDPQETSVSSKTKKRVRISLGSPEIIVMDPNENIVQDGQITTASETENVGVSNASEVGESTDTPEPYVFSFPRYVCVSASDHIIVSNSGSNSIKVFTPEGTYLRTIGSSGSKDGQLKVPYGVCCDQDNNIYVADHYNDRISVFSLEGEFLQHALTAVSGLCRPKSITIRPAHVRKLFVAHGGLRAMEILVYRLEPTPRCISFTCDL